MKVQTLFNSAVLVFAQQPTNARFVSDFYDAVNDGQNEICVFNWGFLRTTGSVSTTSSIRYVALPTDFGSFYNVRGAIRITSPAANLGDKVKLLNFNEYYGKEYDDDETGQPTFCWTQSDNIYFSPIPDTTYVVAFPYYKRPTTIENTDTLLTIPDIYIELLRKNVYRRLRDMGYAPFQEIMLDDNDIARLLNRFMRDDIARYGGMTFNLNPAEYDVETV